MKRSLGEKTFGVFNTIFMVLICVISVYPYLNQLAISLNDGRDAMAGGITIFPRKFTWENYVTVFSNPAFLQAAKISVLRVVCATTLALLVTYAAAYGLTRRGLPYRKFLTLFLMLPGYIPVGTIPTYINISNLGLLDNFWVYILPSLFGFYNMIIIRSYLQELPPEMEESAKIDGANDFVICFRIILPLVRNMFFTIYLLRFILFWNDYQSPLLYLPTHPTLSLGAYNLRTNTSSDVAGAPAQMAICMIMLLPVLVLFVAFRNMIMGNISMGGVKE